jgi:hypothetical protein
MPIVALGFFMESNFVKYLKGEFNGKREIFAFVGVFSNEPSVSN